MQFMLRAQRPEQTQQQTHQHHKGIVTTSKHEKDTSDLLTNISLTSTVATTWKPPLPPISAHPSSAVQRFGHSSQQTVPEPASTPIRVTVASSAPIASVKSTNIIDSNTSSSISASVKRMQHSYTRDTPVLGESVTGLPSVRTVFVRHAPQCPSCHTNPLEEYELDNVNQAAVPTYNEIAAREAMNEAERMTKHVRNTNSDNEPWEARINQVAWTNVQRTLFANLVSILDDDQLGRLANHTRQNEAMQRRAIINKSAARMRQALASVSWDARLTQWLHYLLMDHLPPTYMASYLDILQTLNAKMPKLIDKMLFGRMTNFAGELLAPVMSNPWEPTINTKPRKLSQNSIIVSLPSTLTGGPLRSRLDTWYKQLSSITEIVEISLPASGNFLKLPLEQIAEQVVSLARVKIQELRNENPSRNIILIGFNAGAALALQVAMSEVVACVICLGFAYNTLNGSRGAPDDRILDIKTPILFIIGQNAQRSSVEELEHLREKMISESSLVVVGSADDYLNVPTHRLKLENASQCMVDSMVVDEIHDYVQKIFEKPPGSRLPTPISNVAYSKQIKAALIAAADSKTIPLQRKRKQDGALDTETSAKNPKVVVPHIGRPRTRPVPTPSVSGSPVRGMLVSGKSAPQQKVSTNALFTTEDLNMAMQSILNDSSELEECADAASSDALVSNAKLMTSYEIVSPQTKSSGDNVTTIGGGTKIKMVTPNQFLQLKTPLQSQSKIYTIKTGPVLNQSNLVNTSIGSIVSTAPSNASVTGQQQIFTLKSPNGQTTQFVTAAPATAQQKYTVVKNASGGTTLQLTTGAKTTRSMAAGVNDSAIDIPSIIDLPILFADNDGNLTDTVASPASGNTALGVGTSPLAAPTSSTNINPRNSSGVGQLIISQKIIKEATVTSAGANPVAATAVAPKGTILIKPNSIVQQTQPQSDGGIGIGGGGGKPGKLVFINRSTMKPCPSIISRPNVSTQLPKYTKVVVTNPKTGVSTLVQRPVLQGSGDTICPTEQHPINVQRQSGVLNVSTKSLPQVQLINTSAVGGSGTSGADKPQYRNFVLKSATLKQIPTPQHLSAQLLNRNLTVRKLINIVPAPKTTIATTTPSGSGSGGGVTISMISSPPTPAANDQQEEMCISATTSSSTPTSAAPSVHSSMQTLPKIMKLNPINPSASVTTTSTISAAAVSQPNIDCYVEGDLG